MYAISAEKKKRSVRKGQKRVKNSTQTEKRRRRKNHNNNNNTIRLEHCCWCMHTPKPENQPDTSDERKEEEKRKQYNISK